MRFLESQNNRNSVTLGDHFAHLRTCYYLQISTALQITSALANFQQKANRSLQNRSHSEIFFHHAHLLVPPSADYKFQLHILLAKSLIEKKFAESDTLRYLFCWPPTYSYRSFPQMLQF